MVESTGQEPKYEPGSEQNPVDLAKPPAVGHGHLGGLKGGAARAEALCPRKRSQIAAGRPRHGGDLPRKAEHSCRRCLP